jgi:hypothetical protein
MALASASETAPAPSRAAEHVRMSTEQEYSPERQLDQRWITGKPKVRRPQPNVPCCRQYGPEPENKTDGRGSRE